MSCLKPVSEGEDDEIERAVEILTDVATREHQKGDEQELFFFYGGDVSVRNCKHI